MDAMQSEVVIISVDRQTVALHASSITGQFFCVFFFVLPDIFYVSREISREWRDLS